MGVGWLALARVSGWLTARPSDDDTLSRVVGTGAHTRRTEERVAPLCPYIVETEACMVYGEHKTHLLRVINGYTGPGLAWLALSGNRRITIADA